MAVVHAVSPPATFTGFAEHENGYFDSPISATYVLIQSAVYAFDIEELIILCATGSATVTIEIDGTPVGDLSAKAVTTSEATYPASAPKTVPVGGTVTMVLVVAGTCFGMAWTYKTLRA